MAVTGLRLHLDLDGLNWDDDDWTGYFDTFLRKYLDRIKKLEILDTETFFENFFMATTRGLFSSLTSIHCPTFGDCELPLDSLMDVNWEVPSSLERIHAECFCLSVFYAQGVNKVKWKPMDPTCLWLGIIDTPHILPDFDENAHGEALRCLRQVLCRAEVKHIGFRIFTTVDTDSPSFTVKLMATLINYLAGRLPGDYVYTIEVVKGYQTEISTLHMGAAEIAELRATGATISFGKGVIAAEDV